jgi:acetyl/propionyl-CoA carboxylase alpha subunit
MRTCGRLGIKTVAVYSEADRQGLHVQQADEAHFLGGAAPQESYLSSENILEAARASGAEAVHPGYGFLSENPIFARHCREAGVCFIGPPPEVMEQMGDKLRARQMASEAGLPVLPGANQPVDLEHAEAQAQALGFPLVVKPAAGGGGIGIHIISSPDELTSAIQRTRQVAASAFGNSRFYFERYIEGASHIEVQLIGDQQGHLIHLGERDCSIQRRHQKLIEETPAIKLAPGLRQRVYELALRLGRRVGYTNAGTVEFLLSPDGRVYFLEMNPRLQVEHGVTELVTGVDVVELQIRVAAGEPLPLSQKDIKARGHAIEARIYPEDPETFMPDAGTITELHVPSGRHIRVDSALCPGYQVSLHYEALLAKVMAWGESRGEAIRRLRRALAAFRLEGVKCNIPLLRNILSTKEFTKATHHTGSLVEWMNEKRQTRLDPLNNRSLSPNGREKADREIAAAIAVAMAMSLKGSPLPGSRVISASPWRAHGRREQFQSRTLGRRGWR